MIHSGKCVVVTGGASGIGAAIVAHFVKEGARVCILDVDPEALFSMESGAELRLLCDVADPFSVQSAFDSIQKQWDHLDILINNAGISIREDFKSISLDTWNRILAVNLTGPFFAAQRAVASMHQGAILNMASVSGMIGMPHYLSYNVSKAGLIEMTKTLALELAPSIRVNAICPGYVLTPMQKKEYTPEALATCATKIPLQRLGDPKEIAALASYLASPAAMFITGQTFVIDGGEIAGGLASQRSEAHAHHQIGVCS